MGYLALARSSWAIQPTGTTGALAQVAPGELALAAAALASLT